MQVKLSWTERFLNWMPHNTKLYFRGESRWSSKDHLTKLFEEAKTLTPFFNKVVETERKFERDRIYDRFVQFPNWYSAFSQKPMNGQELFVYNKIKEFMFEEEE